MHFSIFNHAEYLLEDRKSPACVPGITIMLCSGRQGTSEANGPSELYTGPCQHFLHSPAEGASFDCCWRARLCLGRLWGDDGDSDQPNPACRASLLGNPGRFTNTCGTRSCLHTCGSLRGSSRLMDTSEEDELCGDPEQQAAKD